MQRVKISGGQCATVVFLQVLESGQQTQHTLAHPPRQSVAASRELMIAARQRAKVNR